MYIETPSHSQITTLVVIDIIMGEGDAEGRRADRFTTPNCTYQFGGISSKGSSFHWGPCCCIDRATSPNESKRTRYLLTDLLLTNRSSSISLILLFLK